MRTRTAAAVLAVLLALITPSVAQSLQGDSLYRFTLLRAAPGRLLARQGRLGSSGATQVRLDAADGATLRHALFTASRETAPKTIADPAKPARRT